MADHDGLSYDIKLDVPEHIDIHEITRDIKSPSFTSGKVYGYIHDNRDPDDMGDYNDWIEYWKYFVLFPKTRSLVRAKQTSEEDWSQPGIIYEMYIGTIHNGSLLWLSDKMDEKTIMNYLKQQIFVVAGESHKQDS